MAFRILASPLRTVGSSLRPSLNGPSRSFKKRPSWTNGSSAWPAAPRPFAQANRRTEGMIELDTDRGGVDPFTVAEAAGCRGWGFAA
jgi:hypothetical protein